SQFCDAIDSQDSIVLVKGARQVGKTSLLARGLDKARHSRAAVIPIDFQQFNSEAFKSADTLLLAMAARIGDELDLDTKPHVSWDSDLGASSNFESFIRRRVLGSTHSHVVLGLDEVDRIFDFDYAGEIFGLFRSWHNRRALDPLGPWSRLTIAIAY